MNTEQKTVMVVDDERGIRESLKMILKDRYRLLEASSAEQALELLGKTPQEIDVVFSDILMCNMNGIQFLEKLKKQYPHCEAVLMTAYPTMETSLAALRLGAADYLVKPFGVEEILDATQRALSRKRTVVRNHEKIKDLQQEIEKNYDGTTRALISAINARDRYTAGHSCRVSKLMGHFARFLKIEPERVQKLETISYLHDIGKIGISENILNKPAALTPEEYEEMKLHTFIGYKILQPVEYLRDVLDAMLYHQERFDGTGYPAGLKDYEIPLGARMLAIVDAYDAMTSGRPYREKLSPKDALADLRANAGTQFDSSLVTSFVEMLSKLETPILAKTSET